MGVDNNEHQAGALPGPPPGLDLGEKELGDHKTHNALLRRINHTTKLSMLKIINHMICVYIYYM